MIFSSNIYPVWIPEVEVQDSGQNVSLFIVLMIWLGHSLSWLQLDHTAQIYNSAVVLFGWNSRLQFADELQWTEISYVHPPLITGHLPNTIMKSMSWIRLWDLNIFRWSNLSRHERFAKIGQFHHFDHFGAQVLLLWCLKKSRAWQRLMNSYYHFIKVSLHKIISNLTQPKLR